MKKKRAASFFSVGPLCSQKQVNSICKGFTNEKPVCFTDVWITGERDWLPDVLRNPDSVWIELGNGDMVEFRKHKVHKSKETK